MTGRPPPRGWRLPPRGWQPALRGWQPAAPRIPSGTCSRGQRRCRQRGCWRSAVPWTSAGWRPRCVHTAQPAAL